MSAEYLNEIEIHWKFITIVTSGYSLRFYGITKDPETEEFMMVLDVAQKGNLRSFLSRYSHKDFHNDEKNNEDNQDSQLVDLEVSSSLLQSKDDISNENSIVN
ncbi:unnamed protein product [Rhizophagus irregularis]|nr:unnamed protein product [Rhizophagus irregularis]